MNFFKKLFGKKSEAIETEEDLIKELDKICESEGFSYRLYWTDDAPSDYTANHKMSCWKIAYKTPGAEYESAMGSTGKLMVLETVRDMMKNRL